MSEEMINGACETYKMPKDGWVCFHCGERFTTSGSAEDHFGATPGSLAGCQIKAGEERGLLMELRKAEKRADEQMQRALDDEREIETLECRISALTTDFKSFKPFKDCNSANEAFFVYDSVEGRALAHEENFEALLEALGWKRGSFTADTRDMIMHDAALLRPEMAKARREAQEAAADRSLLHCLMSEGSSGLLKRVWDAKIKAESRSLDTDSEMQLRRYLWLSHGHRGLYGDDGEMQCGECNPHWDYKNLPLAEIVKAADDARTLVNLRAASEMHS
jgi:hypothetical protein